MFQGSTCPKDALKAFSMERNNLDLEGQALYDLYMTGHVEAEHATQLSVVQEALNIPEQANLIKQAILDRLAMIFGEYFCSLPPHSPARILAKYAYKKGIEEPISEINVSTIAALAPFLQEAHIAGLSLSKKPCALILGLHYFSFYSLPSATSFIQRLSTTNLSFDYLYFYVDPRNPSQTQSLLESLSQLDFSPLKQVDFSNRNFDESTVELMVKFIAILPTSNKLIFNFNSTNYLKLNPELRRTLLNSMRNTATMLRISYNLNTFSDWANFFAEIKNTSINGLGLDYPALKNTDLTSQLARSNINFLEIDGYDFQLSRISAKEITDFFAALKNTKVESLSFIRMDNLSKMTEEQLNAFCIGLKEAGILKLKFQACSAEQLTEDAKSRLSACIMQNIKDNEKRHGTLKGLIMHSLWEQQPELLEQIQDSTIGDVQEDIKNAVASFKAAVTF